MPKTYEPIARQALTTSAATVTFSSIPSTYTDLIAVVNGQITSDSQIRMQFNSDTGTNYSATMLFGDGSAAYSIRVSSETSMNIGGVGTEFGTTVIHFMNYSNTTTYKTVLGNYRMTSSSYGETGAKVGLWRSTAAINSISFILPGSRVYFPGSNITLYGIKAA